MSIKFTHVILAILALALPAGAEEIEFCVHQLLPPGILATGHAFVTWKEPGKDREGVGLSFESLVVLSADAKTAEFKLFYSTIPGEIHRVTYPDENYPDNDRHCVNITRARFNQVQTFIKAKEGQPQPYQLLTQNCINFAKGVWEIATGKILNVSVWNPQSLSAEIYRLNRDQRIKAGQAANF